MIPFFKKIKDPVEDNEKENIKPKYKLMDYVILIVVLIFLCINVYKGMTGEIATPVYNTQTESTEEVITYEPTNKKNGITVFKFFYIGYIELTLIVVVSTVYASIKIYKANKSNN